MICENARHENMTFHPRFHDSERSSLQRTEWMSWTTPMLCTLLFFSYDTFSLYWLYRIAGTNIGVWKRTDKLSGLICVIRQYSFSEITSEKLFLNHLILPVSIHHGYSCLDSLSSISCSMAFQPIVAHLMRFAWEPTVWKATASSSTAWSYGCWSIMW